MRKQPLEIGTFLNDLVLLDEAYRPFLRGVSRQLPLPRIEIALTCFCAAIFLIGLIFAPVTRLPSGDIRHYSLLVPLAAGFGLMFGIGAFTESRRALRLSRDGTLLAGTILAVLREPAAWSWHRFGGSPILYVIEFKLPAMTPNGVAVFICQQRISVTTYNGLCEIPNVVGRPLAVMFVNPKLFHAL